MRQSKSLTSEFWRYPDLPFIEARQVTDGRTLCYAPHSHATFSIGAITNGTCTYFNRDARQQISAGSIVLMNPGDVHACNPVDAQAWAYVMLYVDCAWLGRLQQQLGFTHDAAFKRLNCIYSQDKQLHAELLKLHQCLVSNEPISLKQHATEQFFTLMLERLHSHDESDQALHTRLEQAAAFIRKHCANALSVEDICFAAGLSASYLTREFKQHYGMTPHAYLIDQRVQLARQLIREGHALADVATQAGFADQAHFQRTFKHLLAATPGHYQSHSGTNR